MIWRIGELSAGFSLLLEQSRNELCRNIPIILDPFSLTSVEPYKSLLEGDHACKYSYRYIRTLFARQQPNCAPSIFGPAIWNFVWLRDMRRRVTSDFLLALCVNPKPVTTVGCWQDCRGCGFLLPVVNGILQQSTDYRRHSSRWIRRHEVVDGNPPSRTCFQVYELL